MLSINEDNLSNEFAAQAALYGHIAVLTAEAEEAVANAKNTRELAEAEADEYWRKKLRMDAEVTGVKVTESVVHSAVVLDEGVISAKTKELNMIARHKKMKAVTDALKMRGDMLISLGAHFRAEVNMIGMHTNEDR